MLNPPVQLPHSAETQLHSSLNILPEKMPLNKKGNIREIWLGYEFQNGLKMSLRLKDVEKGHLEGISQQFRLLAEAYDRFVYQVMG